MLNARSADFISHFFRAHPRRTTLMTALLILAGLAEGVGVAALLPLLKLAVGGESAAPPSGITRAVTSGLARMGLEPTLGTLLGLIVAAMILKGGLLWLAMREIGYTIAQVATDLRLRLVQALAQARWSYFTEQPTGQYASAISAEARRASWAYKDACAAFADLIQVVIYLGVAFLISWPVALGAIAGGGALVGILSAFVQRSRSAGAQQTGAMQSLVERLSELLPNLKPVKAMAREGPLLRLLKREARAYNRAERRAVLAYETTGSFREPIIVVLMAAGLYGALTVGNLPFSTVLVLAILFYRLVLTLGGVQGKYQKMVQGESAFDSLRGHIRRAEAARERSAGRKAPPSLTRHLRLNDVTVAYDSESAPVLDDVSMKLPAGAFAVLTGPSGAGKTTLVDLLPGLLLPNRGTVLVDGVPLRQLDLAAWRAQVGYVPQERLLLHSSVYENVTLGDDALDRRTAEHALRTAAAWNFVEALPQGLDTSVGERGTRLSGGQRQRIMIARALVTQPRLLILDEATSALDPGIERDVCRALRDLRGEMTIVAVSHQPAVREAADLVFEVSGRGVEQVAPPRMAAS